MNTTDNDKLTKGSILKLFVFLLGIVILIALDQFTKYIVVENLKGDRSYEFIHNILSFEYLENTGVAFGFLPGKQIIINIISITMTIGLILFIVRLENIKENHVSKYTFIQILCCFVVAGAIGNTIDRLKNKYVIDFIKTDFIDFPIFNIADIYVTVAVGILLIVMMFFVKDEEFSAIFKKGN